MNVPAAIRITKVLLREDPVRLPPNPVPMQCNRTIAVLISLRPEGQSAPGTSDRQVSFLGPSPIMLQYFGSRQAILPRSGESGSASPGGRVPSLSSMSCPLHVLIAKDRFQVPVTPPFGAER